MKSFKNLREELNEAPSVSTLMGGSSPTKLDAIKVAGRQLAPTVSRVISSIPTPVKTGAAALTAGLTAGQVARSALNKVGSGADMDKVGTIKSLNVGQPPSKLQFKNDVPTIPSEQKPAPKADMTPKPTPSVGGKPVQGKDVQSAYNSKYGSPKPSVQKSISSTPDPNAGGGFVTARASQTPSGLKFTNAPRGSTLPEPTVAKGASSFNKDAFDLSKSQPSVKSLFPKTAAFPNKSVFGAVAKSEPDIAATANKFSNLGSSATKSSLDSASSKLASTAASSDAATAGMKAASAKLDKLFGGK